MKEAEELLKDKDATKEALEAKSESLAKSAQKLGEAMYAKAQADQASEQQTSGGQSKPSDDKVVDAEYTEVNDKK